MRELSMQAQEPTAHSERAPWNPVRGTTCLGAWGINPSDYDWTPVVSESEQKELTNG